MKTLKYIIIPMFMLLPYSIILAQCSTPPSNLISWWTGDDTTEDLYGSNHGTSEGGLAYGQGVVNNAFYFDGIDDVVVAADSDDLDLTGDMTLELWVKQTGFLNAIQTVICKGAGDVPNNEPAVFLMHFETATTKFYFKDTTGAYIEKGGPTFEDFSWHHYAYVRQGNMHIMYADGFDFGWESFTNPPTSSIGLPLTIGAEYHNPTSSANDYSRFFTGLVDEIGVYNRALSEAEIQSIYNAGSDGKCRTALRIEDELLSENQIKTYPNPVKNTFTLDISKSTFLASGNLRLMIFDLGGRLVKQVDNINTLKRNIDINDFTSGMYLYQLTGNGSALASGKIIKK